MVKLTFRDGLLSAILRTGATPNHTRSRASLKSRDRVKGKVCSVLLSFLAVWAHAGYLGHRPAPARGAA